MLNFEDLKPHKLNTFPPMNEVEYQELKNSILENGYDDRFPIIVWKGLEETEYGVIDGANRLRACIELNEVPLIDTFYAERVQHVVDFIIQTNVRRSLTAGQKAAVILDMEEVVREISGYGKVAKANAGANNLAKYNNPTDSEDLTSEVPGDLTSEDVLNEDVSNASEGIAKMAGVGASTIKRMKAIKKNSEELYDAVKDGSLSAKAVYEQIKESEAKAKAVQQGNDENYHFRSAATKLSKTLVEDAYKANKTFLLNECIKALKEQKELSLEDVNIKIEFKVVKS